MIGAARRPSNSTSEATFEVESRRVHMADVRLAAIWSPGVFSAWRHVHHLRRLHLTFDRRRLPDTRKYCASC